MSKITHHFIASTAFSKQTLKTLAKRNIFVIGIQMVPDATRGWFDARKCFVISNNEQCQVRTLFEVIALAE
mgnify:CR=1 FL=1